MCAHNVQSESSEYFSVVMNTDLRHLTLHQIKLILFTLSSMTFLPLASPALLLNFFIGAIIFNFQKLFYTLSLFFFFFSTAYSVFL